MRPVYKAAVALTLTLFLANNCAFALDTSSGESNLAVRTGEAPASIPSAAGTTVWMTVPGDEPDTFPPIAVLPMCRAEDQFCARSNESILGTALGEGDSPSSSLDDESDLPDSTKIAAWDSASDPSQLRGAVGATPLAIERLTRQIILNEIALERFNLNYRLNAAKQGRWKGLRYAFLQEANNGMGITGGIIGTVERGRNLHHSSKVRPCIQQQANFIPAIGNVIAFSAAFVEFNINEFHEYQAWRKGFSPGKGIAHVNGLNADLNRLLTERDGLVKAEQGDSSLSQRASTDMLEGKVLRDLRDLSLMEFQRFHVGARKTIAFQQTQYLFDMAKYTTNALGFYFAYMALHRGDRRWNVRAGVMFDIAGGLITAGPILSRAYAKLAGEFTKYKLRDTVHDVQANQVAILQQDQTALEGVLRSSGNVDAQVDRLAVYGDRSKRFQDALESSSKERSKAKLTATQNVGAGIIVGGSKIASGTLFTVLGHKRYRSKTQTAGRVTNHLLFASGVVGLQASSFSFADTLRIQVQGEINRHKLAVAHKLPNELVHARLKQLDDLETKLKSRGD